MSALEFLFLGDATWQAHRIANSVESLQRQVSLQHSDTMSALDRVARLQDEQLALSRQRYQLMEQLRDDDARRRNVTGALVLHESELDRLVEARESLKQPAHEELSPEAHQQLIAFARSLEVDAAMRARMIELGLALSEVTIASMTSIADQRQFLAIQQKAQSEWASFCRRADQETVDRVEFAALSALCERRIQDHAYLACACVTISQDQELTRHFDGSMDTQARTAAHGTALGAAAIKASTGAGRLLGGICGALAGFLGSAAIMQAGGWYLLWGALGLIPLTILGWQFGQAIGESLGQRASTHVVTTERDAAVDGIHRTWVDGVERAVDLATSKFIEAIGTRLTYADPSHAHYRQWLASFAPHGLKPMWEQCADFWSRLVVASPAVRKLAPFDTAHRALYDRRTVDVLVAVIHAREALSR